MFSIRRKINSRLGRQDVQPDACVKQVSADDYMKREIPSPFFFSRFSFPLDRAHFFKLFLHPETNCRCRAGFAPASLEGEAGSFCCSDTGIMDRHLPTGRSLPWPAPPGVVLFFPVAPSFKAFALITRWALHSFGAAILLSTASGPTDRRPAP